MATRALARRAATRLAAMASFAAVVLYPALLLACPVCAGRNEGGAVARGVLIGLIIFFPFAVVYAVIRFMRSEERLRKQSGLQGKVQDAFH